MVITDQAQFEQLVQEVRDQILSESQGVGEVDIVDNLDSIYSLPALKLNDNGDQVVEAPLSLLSAPAEEAAALAKAAANDANTAAESANSAVSSANQVVKEANTAISNATLATQKAEASAEKANTAADTANQAAQKADNATTQVLSGESERVEAENARQAAETERQSAEEERKSAEEARKLAERSRKEAEASRVSAEESRVTAESERVTAELSRAQAETERVQKESERESAESTRQQNETARQSNEDTRNQQEQTRQTNEEQRVSAESSRETEYADLKQRSDALIDDNEAAIENANTAADNANAAIANMENTYAKKDEIPDISEFVTTTVDNLVNYYRKSETYNQEQINSLIGSITTINFKIVDSLPGTGENNLIYLVPSSKQEENNVKDEYIWVDDSWELIGSTKIDLSNYYTRDEVNSTFALKTELAWDTITGKPVWIGSSKPTYTWSEINEKPTTLTGYGITDAYTKAESDSKYVTLSTEQTITGAKTFTESISLNQKSIHITNASTYDATGFYWHKRSDGSIISAIGSKTTDGNTLDYLFLGWGTSPYDTETSLAVSNSFLKYKNYNILHTGNYTSTLDTRYVKKSGDTMTGALTVPSLAVSGSTATVSGNKIWHAGNDGSGSGLDADLLDGYHIKNIQTGGWIHLTPYVYDSTNGIRWYWYKIATISDSSPTFHKIEIDAKGNSNYTYAARCTLYLSNFDSGITKSVTISEAESIDNYGKIEVCMDTSGNVYIRAVNITWTSYLRYRILYGSYGTVYESPTKTEAKPANTSTAITHGGIKLNKPNTFEYSHNYLQGISLKARQLNAVRTIWGQSFDGTTDVSGDLSNVRHIYTYNSNGCYNMFSGYAEGESLRIVTKDRNGTVSTTGLTILTDGRVGFSTISPQYRVDVNGDIRATGNIIGTVSSDIQLKTILDTIDYQDKLLSLGDVVEYKYNEIAFDRSNSSTLQHRTYTGLIYQNVKDVLPSMTYEDQDGYGCLNYLSYDYINLIAGALQQTITKQKQLEKRISILEEENINLKQQLSN